MDRRRLDALSRALGEVYGEITDRVIVNLARHFKFVAEGRYDKPGGAFEFQAQKLAELGQVNRETARLITGMLDGADEAVQRALEEAILDALTPLEPELRRAARMGLLTPRLDVPADLSPRMTRAFRAYYAQAADKLNLVNTAMLESTGQAYRATVSDVVNRVELARRTLNTAAGQIITGTESFNAAQRQAVKKLVEGGITGFVDHGGRKWRPETYVAMDMRSTMHNASREAFWDRCDDYGNDLYLVSQHPGARPLCYPWQCKVISRADRAREVRDGEGNTVRVYAQSETSYGEPAGLFGINCGHAPELFIPGVTTIDSVRQTPEENAQTYAESQKQRALERQLRRAKLEAAVAKAQGDREGAKAAREKLKRAEEQLEEFTEATGRKRRSEREYRPMNATWPGEAQTDAGKALTDEAKGDRIDSRTWYERNIEGKPEMETKYQAALIKAKEESRMDGEWDMPRRPEDLQDYSFDEKHVNDERHHGVSKEEAEDYIKDAIVMVTRNKGSYVNFYGLNGCAYLMPNQKRIRTAFKLEQYTPNVNKLLEVIMHELGIQ